MPQKNKFFLQSALPFPTTNFLYKQLKNSPLTEIDKEINNYLLKKVENCGGLWWNLLTFAAKKNIKRYMIRFLGNIEAKADAKGRAFLPALFRRQLQAAGEDSLVLRKDVFQQCLVLYPESVWNQQMDLLRQRLNRWNKQHQQVYRQFVSDVELLTLDGNGRFLIPKRYQRMAGIEQDIRFIGMGDTIEIWSMKVIEQQQLPAAEFEESLQQLMAGEI